MMLDKRKSPIATVIQDALGKLMGGCYITQPTASKLKDGTRVYRIAGSSPSSSGYLFKDDDGKIYCYVDAFGRSPKIEIPRSVLGKPYHERFRPELHWYEWEWYVLDIGAEKIEVHLTEALNAAGYGVDVRVGNRFGGSALPTSIAVRILGLQDQIDEDDTIVKSIRAGAARGDRSAQIAYAIMELIAEVRRRTAA